MPEYLTNPCPSSHGAKAFYAGTLGLRVSDVPDMGGLMTLNVAGDRDILV